MNRKIINTKPPLDIPISPAGHPGLCLVRLLQDILPGIVSANFIAHTLLMHDITLSAPTAGSTIPPYFAFTKSGSHVLAGWSIQARKNLPRSDPAIFLADDIQAIE